MNSLSPANRREHYQKERNRFSVLLSLLRRRLPASQFRELLHIQLLCDEMWRLCDCGARFQNAWLSALHQELNVVFECLEADRRFSRRQLGRLVHLYRDLLLMN